MHNLHDIKPEKVAYKLTAAEKQGIAFLHRSLGWRIFERRSDGNWDLGGLGGWSDTDRLYNIDITTFAQEGYEVYLYEQGWDVRL